MIAYQARLLKAPRIAAYHHRLAEQGRAANWSLEGYLGAVPAGKAAARAGSVARQRIQCAGFLAIKATTDLDFTAQPQPGRTPGPRAGPADDDPSADKAAGTKPRASSMSLLRHTQQSA